MSDPDTRPDGDELEEQLTIAETDGAAPQGSATSVDGDPATDDSVGDGLPEGLEEPDPPVGLP